MIGLSCPPPSADRTYWPLIGSGRYRVAARHQTSTARSLPGPMTSDPPGNALGLLNFAGAYPVRMETRYAPLHFEWRRSLSENRWPPSLSHALGASRLRGLHAAGYRIEDSQFRLFNHGDGVVDRQAGFPFKPIGLAFRTPNVQIMLLLRDS